MNIVLIGFMASGKSTIGELLAERIDFQFIDVDQKIEAAAEKKIADIFAQEGEPVFRDLETAELKKLLKADRNIISCGGGIVIKEENRKLLKKIGKVFFLEVAAEDVLNRITDYSSRPLLNNADPKKRKQIIEELLKKRDNFYRDSADFIIKTKTGDPESDVQKIISILQKEKSK